MRLPGIASPGGNIYVGSGDALKNNKCGNTVARGQPLIPAKAGIHLASKIATQYGFPPSRE